MPKYAGQADLGGCPCCYAFSAHADAHERPGRLPQLLGPSSSGGFAHAVSCGSSPSKGQQPHMLGPPAAGMLQLAIVSRQSLERPLGCLGLVLSPHTPPPHPTQNGAQHRTLQAAPGQKKRLLVLAQDLAGHPLLQGT